MRRKPDGTLSRAAQLSPKHPGDRRPVNGSAPCTHGLSDSFPACVSALRGASTSHPRGISGTPNLCDLGAFRGPNRGESRVRAAFPPDLPGVLFFQALPPLHSPPPHFPATSSLVTSRAVCDSPCIQTLQHRPTAGEYSRVPLFRGSKWERCC